MPDDLFGPLDLGHWTKAGDPPKPGQKVGRAPQRPFVQTRDTFRGWQPGGDPWGQQEKTRRRDALMRQGLSREDANRKVGW